MLRWQEPISPIRKYLQENKEEFSQERFEYLYEQVEHACDLFKKYGGKIFAFGRAASVPIYNEDVGDIQYWGSNLYTDIDEICVLEQPIDISEFNSFIAVSRQSGLTPVYGDDFEQLKSLIVSKNNVPEYFLHSYATPIPLRDINDENWLTVTKSYRRAFLYELQFRRYYVDYLLRSIGDQKKFWSECKCYKETQLNRSNPPRVDNVFKLNNKFILVEDKLTVPAECDIKAQVRNYCYCDRVQLDDKRVISGDEVLHNKVLIIDTEKLYLYNYDENEYRTIIELDRLQDGSDLDELRKLLIKELFD